jgi:hypothetical protein
MFTDRLQCLDLSLGAWHSTCLAPSEAVCLWPSKRILYPEQPVLGLMMYHCYCESRLIVAYIWVAPVCSLYVTKAPFHNKPCAGRLFLSPGVSSCLLTPPTPSLRPRLPPTAAVGTSPRSASRSRWVGQVTDQSKMLITDQLSIFLRKNVPVLVEQPLLLPGNMGRPWDQVRTAALTSIKPYQQPDATHMPETQCCRWVF